MAEYSANAIQTVNPGESVIFDVATEPCTRGLVRHRDGTGSFLLSGWSPRRSGCRCCGSNSDVDYLVIFGANVVLPEGGTPGEVSLAIVVDGATVPASQMTETLAAVGDVANVSRSITVPIWRGCCETVAVRNTSDQPIQVQNANIIIRRPDLNVTL